MPPQVVDNVQRLVGFLMGDTLMMQGGGRGPAMPRPAFGFGLTGPAPLPLPLPFSPLGSTGNSAEQVRSNTRRCPLGQ
jgi:hypothetical protein